MVGLGRNRHYRNVLEIITLAAPHSVTQHPTLVIINTSHFNPTRPIPRHPKVMDVAFLNETARTGATAKVSNTSYENSDDSTSLPSLDQKM